MDGPGCFVGVCVCVCVLSILCVHVRYLVDGLGKGIGQSAVASIPAAQPVLASGVDTEEFRDQLDKMIVKTIRPPTNRHLGTKMRETKFISITPEVWQEQLSIAKGLPPEDEDAGLLRIQESGVVKPTKTSTPRAPLPAQREMLVE